MIKKFKQLKGVFIKKEALFSSFILVSYIHSPEKINVTSCA